MYLCRESGYSNIFFNSLLPFAGAHDNRIGSVATMDTETAQSDFSDGNEINKPFLKRLAGCAAPIMSKGESISDLAFLRTSRVCGRPEAIVEDDDDDEGSDKPSQDSSEISSTKRKYHPQDSFNITQGSEIHADTRSVISEGFGEKTAFFEALAMKSAVSKPRRSQGRRRGDRSSSKSDVSATSSNHAQKEKWRALLERKNAAGANPDKLTSDKSDVSQAAEKYAKEKVEEMMTMMASRSKSTPRSWRSQDHPDAEKNRVVEDMIRDSSFHTSPPEQEPDYHMTRSSDQDITMARKKIDSTKEAEELAAARVEAMMAALASGPSASGTALDEGEI